MRHQSKYEVQSGENRYGDESLEDVQDGCLRFVATEQIFHVNSLVIYFVALYMKSLKIMSRIYVVIIGPIIKLYIFHFN
jgi:hypothetical protein